MTTLSDISLVVSDALAEWGRVPWSALRFSRISTAALILLVFSVIAVLMVLVRGVRPHRGIDLTARAGDLLLPADVYIHHRRGLLR